MIKYTGAETCKYQRRLGLKVSAFLWLRFRNTKEVLPSSRQWVLATFKLWEGELDFIDSLLEEDIR
jgi:hypothetical protein